MKSLIQFSLSLRHLLFFLFLSICLFQICPFLIFPSLSFLLTYFFFSHFLHCLEIVIQLELNVNKKSSCSDSILSNSITLILLPKCCVCNPIKINNWLHNKLWKNWPQLVMDFVTETTDHGKTDHWSTIQLQWVSFQPSVDPFHPFLWIQTHQLPCLENSTTFLLRIALVEEAQLVARFRKFPLNRWDFFFLSFSLPLSFT